jgi:hypothetical protein
MEYQEQVSNVESHPPEGIPGSNPTHHRRRSLAFKALVLLVIFALGGGDAR